MQLRFQQLAICASLLLLMLSCTARGSVKLTIDSGVVNQVSTSVAPNGTFPVTVRLTSSSSGATDGVVGIDYFLKASTSSLFTLNSRNSTSSVFSPFSADGSVGSSLLVPENNTDLGGTVNDPLNSPASNGTYFVASSPGQYTIAVTDNAAGFVNASFGMGTYSSLGTFTVNVTPEPSALALILGIPLLAARRRV
jgi:hypothetical protein